MKKAAADGARRRSVFFTRDVNMLDGPIISSSVIYTIPLILSSMLASLYNAADIAVIGNLADSNAVASVGATGTIIGLLVNLFIALATGYRIILARAIGQNDASRISRMIKTGYTFSLILGVFVALFGFFFARPMLLLTECPHDVIDGAELYIKIYMLSVPASMFYNFNACVISVKGDTVRPFIYGAISGAVNIVLNFVLVITTGRPIVSVAIATVVSTYVSAILLLIRLLKLEGPYRLNPFKLEINGDVLRKIIQYGVPSMISTATFAIANIQIQSAINSFDAVGISGNTASATVENFAFAISNQVGGAVSAFIGQCIGAGKRERVLAIIKKSYLLWSGVGVFVGVLLLLFGKNLMGIIIPGEYEAIEFGFIRLRYIAIGITIHTLMNVNSGILNGFGKTLYTMIVNIIGVCGFRLLWMLVVYPTDQTPNTLYLCYPISFALVACVGLLIALVAVRKYKKGANFDI